MRNRNILLLITALLILPSAIKAQSTWPKKVATDWAKVVAYQPQADSMHGDTTLYLKSAISIVVNKSKSPVFGVMWIKANTRTDKTKGTCSVLNLKLVNVRFPGIDTLDKSRVKRFRYILEKEASDWKMELPIDEIKSSINLGREATATTSGFKNDPPEIIYVKQKSALVLFDGDPVWKETGEDGIKRAINTPFYVLMDGGEKSYYLMLGESWYRSSNPVNSPWATVSQPSAGVQRFYDSLKSEKEKSGKKSQQAQQKPSDTAAANPPAIIVRTKPAELIQSKGEPKYTDIKGTKLRYMTNSDNNILRDKDQKLFYVLLSGRWYSSPALTGPWVYTESDKLPADFAKIPKDSKPGVVLASVAGTDVADDALLDAQIPKTAAVNRKKAKTEVKWDGDPKFEKIKGTDLARGSNTSSIILLYKDQYFVCDNGIWFTGKGPEGPWQVATSVPDEIQKIPPDDPAYNVKYVHIYEVKPEVVYVGYTAGYTSNYVYGPTVVYGTGISYPNNGPVYYPRPSTFGYGMGYDPWIGWSIGFTISMSMFSVGLSVASIFLDSWWGPSYYRPYGGYWGGYYGYSGYYDSYYGSSYSSYSSSTYIDNSTTVNVYESLDADETESLSDLEDLDDMSYDPSEYPDDLIAADQDLTDDPNDPDGSGDNVADDQNNPDGSGDNVADDPNDPDGSGDNVADDPNDPDNQNVADDQDGNDNQVGTETQDDQNAQDNSDDNVEQDNQDNSGVSDDQGDSGNSDPPDPE
ncbi:MAG: hypothetical protein WCR01_02720 [Bacteroidota bacterium]